MAKQYGYAVLPTDPNEDFGDFAGYFERDLETALSVAGELHWGAGIDATSISIYELKLTEVVEPPSE